MDKQKRWQLTLIVAVCLLTLYNILPTIFFYSHPLSAPVDAQRGDAVAHAVTQRIETLNSDSYRWLQSFAYLLGVEPRSIEVGTDRTGLIQLQFRDERDAHRFAQFLPRAGGMIPFYPARLGLITAAQQGPSATVSLNRALPPNAQPLTPSNLFQFTPKEDDHGTIAERYHDLVEDRLVTVSSYLANSTENARAVQRLIQGKMDAQEQRALALVLAEQILDAESVYQEDAQLGTHFFTSFVGAASPKGGIATPLVAHFEQSVASLEKERLSVVEEISGSEVEQALGFSDDVEPSAKKSEAILTRQMDLLKRAIAVVKERSKGFVRQLPPLTPAALLEQRTIQDRPRSETFHFAGYHPLIEGVTVFWDQGLMRLDLYPSVQRLLRASVGGEGGVSEKSKNAINRWLLSEIAMLSRDTDESFHPSEDGFVASLDSLNGARSYLILNLAQLAHQHIEQVKHQVISAWHPESADFEPTSYPLRSFDEYRTASGAEKRLGLVFYAPVIDEVNPTPQFRNASLYVIARGARSIEEKLKAAPSQSENQQALADWNALASLLENLGFIGYAAADFEFPKEFAQDYIFELNGYYASFLQATRENFYVKGSHRFAALDFSDVEQRILRDNQINDQIQEELLRWSEAYHAAQADLDPAQHYLVPAPTKSVFWENLKLSAYKYFHGDERKVLKWGLDLSGGKTVRISLLDHNQRPVTDQEELRQAVRELYHRVNQMGVAERSIRIENSTIVLDFPGSQNLSAAELIQGSAMYFHIVNEKFGSYNAALSQTVHQFLQEVWNEAVVTNRKDLASVNEIAWQHLGGDARFGSMQPKTPSGKILYEQGLRLANPNEYEKSAEFNDALSAIAIVRRDKNSGGDETAHPLLVVFANYALEGANLENIYPGYDPSHGNTLSFGVKRGYEGVKEGSPRDQFYTWTSQFSEENIAGTPKDAMSSGHGWRMAVVLNGSVITSPTLNAPLREGGMISGRFSQREVAQLVADLKAGSLSFTPKILSEENVSPDLGREERFQGIFASSIALVAVVVAMVSYYRFAGLVASCAVLFNIFIMWGVLQNLGAALTLPGIAGIVLTIGMAVDANVLVFERIREEFAQTGRIGQAIQAGYRKAFSAIFDSNLTTIIAALILVQFDSGPIKGFAITLIIGIVSSMFTALFMTRYFFAGWVRNPKNKQLSMAQFLKNTKIDFLSYTKVACVLSAALIVLGAVFFLREKNTIFGMDFTGGYSLVVDLNPKEEAHYRADVAGALLAKGVARQEMQVQELSRPSQLRIQFGMSMNEPGHPFYQLPEVVRSEEVYQYEYQKDPRLNWVVNAIQSAGYTISSQELGQLQNNWTVMSGQFSEAMRNQAVVGLLLALVAILVYITVRFEFKYAVAAVVGLVHDVIITLGVLAMFHAIGFAVQIDLQVVGAIMTIIGYSLNDTIIVFDRVREDVKIMRKSPFREIINHALNVTLSRTIMTSGTTLCVLIALVLFGGPAIFGFSLVMTLGVVIGTFSSLFIASPVMLYLHEKEEEHLPHRVEGRT